MRYFFYTLMIMLLVLTMSYFKVKKDIIKNNWYSDFFEVIEQQKIQTYKLVTFIQNKTINQNQLDIINDFLHALKNNPHNKKNCVYSVEIIIDNEPNLLVQNKIQEWNKEYSSFVNIVPVSEKIAYLAVNDFPSDLCENTDTYYCVNLLRLWSLDLNHDRSVYLDPTLWEAHFALKEKLPSQFAFGLSNLSDKIFAHISFPQTDLRNANLFEIDSSLLIASRTSEELKSIKFMLRTFINKNKPALQHIQKRKTIIDMPYTDYQELLSKRVAWWIDNPLLNFNENIMLDLLGGKAFYIKGTTQDNLINIHRTCNTSKDISSQYVLKGEMNFNILSQVLPGQEAKELLSYIVEWYDYNATIDQDHNQEWKALLEQRWATMTPKQKFYGQMVLTQTESNE
ncbi:hypothetical protein EBR43_11115 [bacterium]|nr:hypothetical protein [bacterium]NBX71386.1 hypothetical protein [bacterium]